MYPSQIELPPEKQALPSSTRSSIQHSSFAIFRPSLPPDPSLPGTARRPTRFRRGAVKSKFLGVCRTSALELLPFHSQ